MKIKDKLHNLIQKEIINEHEVNKILINFGLKWFVFGIMIGVIIEFLLDSI